MFLSMLLVFDVLMWNNPNFQHFRFLYPIMSYLSLNIYLSNKTKNKKFHNSIKSEQFQNPIEKS
jgi:hypothetical protein